MRLQAPRAEDVPVHALVDDVLRKVHAERARDVLVFVRLEQRMQTVITWNLHATRDGRWEGEDCDV